MIVALGALFLFGSCGIAYGVLRATRGSGGTTVTIGPPGPGSPSASASTSVSPSAAAGPDLLVSGLGGSQVSVSNVGTAAAGRFVISVAGKAFIVEDGLPPGSSANFGFACRVGPLTAVADSTQAVDEDDETNNVLTAGPFECASPTASPTASATTSPSATPSTSPTSDPSLPDLVIRQVTSQQVVVANIGGSAAEPFVVDAGKVGTFPVAGLAAGASRALTFPCFEGSIVANADALDQVAESNEGNNTRTDGPFECLADLVVTSIQLDAVTVANQGVGDAGPSVLGINGQTFDVPAILAGKKVTIDYNCFGGTVEAIADLFDDVVESKEGNNTLVVEVGVCP